MGDRAEKAQGPPAIGPVSLISKAFFMGVLFLGLCHVKWCLVAEVGRSLHHQCIPVGFPRDKVILWSHLFLQLKITE